jgi:Flp pilus assembly protein TadD
MIWQLMCSSLFAKATKRMFSLRPAPVVLAVLTMPAVFTACARDVELKIPRMSELTPVQRLNREGVDAIRKHQYEKAEAIFYKAYLYDPSDPFTLNNLGYVSELQGSLDRALKFYALSSEQGGDARIDVSNMKQLNGKSMRDALSNLKDLPMRVNRMNVEAIELLSQHRNFEADILLRHALALQPDNPFTLNNVAVAEEATGDLQGALQHYDAAARVHSAEPIVVTLDRASRGKPVSESAAESARHLRKQLQNISSAKERATMLTMRGVSEANQNDWTSARQDFLQAYSLDPESAFSLNNRGYVAERDGDLETAQFYYSKARRAEDAKARVGLATQQSAEGQPLLAVAADSGHSVDGKLDQYKQSQRRQTGPIELIPRGDNSQPEPSASPENPSTPAHPPAVPPTPR